MKFFPLLLLLGCKTPPQGPMAPLSMMQQAASALATGASVARLVQAQSIQKLDVGGCFAWGAVAEVSEVAATVLAEGGDSYPAISVDLSACVALAGGPIEPVKLPVLEASVDLALHQVGFLLASNGASCEVEAAVEYVGGTISALIADGPEEGKVEIPAVGICAED